MHDDLTQLRQSGRRSLARGVTAAAALTVLVGAMLTACAGPSGPRLVRFLDGQVGGNSCFPATAASYAGEELVNYGYRDGKILKVVPHGSNIGLSLAYIAPITGDEGYGAEDGLPNATTFTGPDWPQLDRNWPKRREVPAAIPPTRQVHVISWMLVLGVQMRNRHRWTRVRGATIVVRSDHHTYKLHSGMSFEIPASGQHCRAFGA